MMAFNELGFAMVNRTYLAILYSDGQSHARWQFKVVCMQLL